MGRDAVRRSPERFGIGALLAVLMFAPAGLLVWRGNLSVDDAVLRFGLAWLVAVCAVGVVSATLAAAPPPAPERHPPEGEPAADEPSP